MRSPSHKRLLALELALDRAAVFIYGSHGGRDVVGRGIGDVDEELVPQLLDTLDEALEGFVDL